MITGPLGVPRFSTCGSSPDCAANPHILDADRGQQLQPLVGRGNLHSALGGQFQLNRRRGISRATVISEQNTAQFIASCNRIQQV